MEVASGDTEEGTTAPAGEGQTVAPPTPATPPTPTLEVPHAVVSEAGPSAAQAFGGAATSGSGPSAAAAASGAAV